MAHLTMIGWLLAASNAFIAARAPQVAAPTRKRKTRSPQRQPGSNFQMKDGTCYQVSPSGAWVRTTLRRHEERSSFSHVYRKLRDGVMQRMGVN